MNGHDFLLEPFISEAGAKKTREVLKKIKILFVEDSLDNQHLVKCALELRGATVDCANNGVQGVIMAEQGDYDIVLMDIHMPVLDGHRASETLRARGFKQPIIALTTSSQPEDRDKSLKAGIDAHVTKPIDLLLLVDTVLSYARFNGFKLAQE